MKRILVRAGMNPWDNFSPEKVYFENSIGTNVGNLVYQYSIYRALMTSDCEVEADGYRIEKGMLSDKQLDEISETYDAYVIPLADAFRDTFQKSMKALTHAVKKLKIPVVIIGVGVRASVEERDSISYPFDDDVKRFVSAVLDKSAVVGVRGNITLEYLKRLGFQEDTQVRAIGCPSFYTYGGDLKIREPRLDHDEYIWVNNSIKTSRNVHEFIRKVMDDYPNAVFIPQLQKELQELYIGAPYHEKGSGIYPINIFDPIFKEGRAKFFVSQQTWYKQANKIGFSVGPRMHGNILPTIAGVPSLVVAKDARMMELVEFHHMAWVSREEVGADTDVRELAARADFHEVERYHRANFENYLKFLDDNQLEHIFTGPDDRGTSALDEKMEQISLRGPVVPFTGLSEKKQLTRLKKYYVYERDLLKSYKSLQKKYMTLKKKKDSFDEVMNSHKSVKRIGKKVVKRLKSKGK